MFIATLIRTPSRSPIRDIFTQKLSDTCIRAKENANDPARDLAEFGDSAAWSKSDYDDQAAGPLCANHREPSSNIWRVFVCNVIDYIMMERLSHSKEICLLAKFVCGWKEFWKDDEKRRKDSAQTLFWPLSFAYSTTTTTTTTTGSSAQSLT